MILQGNKTMLHIFFELLKRMQDLETEHWAYNDFTFFLFEFSIHGPMLCLQSLLESTELQFNFQRNI